MSEQQSSSGYVYTPPLNSPFYHKVISPICDNLIDNQIVPRWITPNQISFCGLLFAVLGVICAKARIYIMVAPFWMLYGLFDNLDGSFFSACSMKLPLRKAGTGNKDLIKGGWFCGPRDWFDCSVIIGSRHPYASCSEWSQVLGSSLVDALRRARFLHWRVGPPRIREGSSRSSDRWKGHLHCLSIHESSNL